jgi:hypothetical protein
MAKHDVDNAADGTFPKQQVDSPSDEPLATLSAKKPMLPFAADPNRDPEDPLRNSNLLSNEKHDSRSDSDTHIGDISDVQNASKRPTNAETTGQKKLTTTQAVIIFVTNEVGIGRFKKQLGRYNSDMLSRYAIVASRLKRAGLLPWAPMHYRHGHAESIHGVQPDPILAKIPLHAEHC